MKLIPSVTLSLLLAGMLGACGKSEAPAPAPAPAPEASAPAPAPAPEAAAPAPAPAPEAAAPAAAPAPEAATPAAAPAAGGDLAQGEDIYKKTCVLCHGAGVAGAPKFGNKDDWAPRIAQGKDVLYKHAMEGFTGKNGMMPPRGGNPKLTDDEIKAAVNYMVSKAS